MFGQNDLGAGLAATGLGRSKAPPSEPPPGLEAVGSLALMPASRLFFNDATAAGGKTFSLKAASSRFTPGSTSWRRPLGLD